MYDLIDDFITEDYRQSNGNKIYKDRLNVIFVQKQKIVSRKQLKENLRFFMEEDPIGKIVYDSLDKI